ncbi:MAG TPA: AlkA N-terminal domain-containing protein [Kofleriaceae bacterium]|nr:AlkA N-terminal domain-containing protein [Kofleriaceae bacterium]
MRDEDMCYQAMKSRDARFDGRFFVAVLTTGIYCRPICPARTPLRRNVRFFACAAAAEAAGFRPCRRCRPESAPGSPTWQGASTTVSRALRLIEQGALDRDDSGALAAQLGVGERHLRRLFARHLGTSPRAVAASRRAHFARALIDATDLPMVQVALASGFGSLRQFNDVIRGVFRRTPTELRRRGGRRSGPAGVVRLRLAFRPPLAWPPLLAFLAARAIPGVEEVDPERGRYRRAFACATGSGTIEVAMAADQRSLELAVSGGAGRSGLPSGLLDLVRRVRRLFDLDADPLAIAARLEPSRLLAPALAAHPGLRVPGAWDRFETLVRAMLGQQISVAAATTLARRLVERCGAALEQPAGSLTHLFPGPEAVAGADLAAIGLPGARAEALRAAAIAVAREPALLDPAGSLEALVERLCGLPGVGPWTAHYLAMRAFHEPDAFPAADLGLRRAAGGIPARELEAMSAAWRPWRAYAAISLWTRPQETSHDHHPIAHRLAARPHRARADRAGALRPRLHRL